MQSILPAPWLKMFTHLLPFPSSASIPNLVDRHFDQDEPCSGALDVSPASFTQEVATYLACFPKTRHVDVYLHDLNGVCRGKRLSIESLASLAQGCYFPLSVYAMCMDGRVVDHSDFSLHVDEPDRLCVPVGGTLRPCARDPEHHAQLLLTMKNPDGSKCELEPRVVLEKILARFHARGLYPVVAAELEFYLIDKQLTASLPAGVSHCFEMDMVPEHHRIIDEIEKQARQQQLPLTGIVAEAEACQYELNFRHTDKVLDACENVLAMKRLAKQVAVRYDHSACFMAKPFSALAGNGMHFHVSLQDKQGNNLFSGVQASPNDALRSSLAGLLALMPESMAILAPNVNAFRRLRKGLDQPLFSSWGYNVRSVALRLPCSDSHNQRFEYRLAGADANPYLVMAIILSGMLYGLERLPICPSLADYTKCADADEPHLPLFQQDALPLFAQSHFLAETLGQTFSQLWLTCKTEELARFEMTVTDTENIWNQ